MATIDTLLASTQSYLEKSSSDLATQREQLDGVIAASRAMRDAAPPEPGAVASLAGPPATTPLQLAKPTTTSQLLVTAALNHQSQGNAPDGTDRDLRHAIRVTSEVHGSAVAAPTGLEARILHAGADAIEWLIKELHLDANEKQVDPKQLRSSLDTVLGALPTAGVAVCTASVPALTADLGAIFSGPKVLIDAALARGAADASHVEQLIREAALHLLSAIGISDGDTVVSKVTSALSSEEQSLIPKLEAKAFGAVIRTPQALARVDELVASQPTDSVATAIADKVNKTTADYFIGSAALVSLLKVLAGVSAGLVIVPGANFVAEGVIAGTGLLAVAAAILGGLAENSDESLGSVSIGVPAIVASLIQPQSDH